MSTCDPIAQEYVRLALRLGRHVEGFVDGYYGPPEFKAEACAEAPRQVAALRDDAARLGESIAAADMDAQRRDYITRQVRAMQTVLRRLSGEELSLSDEAQGCFDITPLRIPESEFEAGLRELDELLPGHGDVATRRAQWNRQFELPAERVLPVLEIALAEVRRLTQTLLDLPADEGVEIQLVSNQPWSGYNWYLGQNHSRIDVNTDLPVRADYVTDLMAHEAYPGHHTEHVTKEQRWYRQAGRLEHSILLLLAPESLIAEAIATVAEDVVFPEREQRADWLRTVLYPLAGITADIALQLRLEQAAEKLDGVGGNAAFLLHEDHRPEEEVVAYLQQYGLRTEKEARQSLRFIRNPAFRAYIFNYFYGRRLLKQCFAVGGVRDVFRWVVSEPVTPSAIVARYELQ